MSKAPQSSPASTLDLAQYRGKIVFLNFWATWCPPCRSEMPAIQKMHQTWDKNKFAMVTVNMNEDHDYVKKYMDHHEYTFPFIYDTGGSLARKYNITGIPTTFIINQQGEIVNKVVGERAWTVEMVKSGLEQR